MKWPWTRSDQTIDASFKAEDSTMPGFNVCCKCDRVFEVGQRVCQEVAAEEDEHRALAVWPGPLRLIWVHMECPK